MDKNGHPEESFLMLLKVRYNSVCGLVSYYSLWCLQLLCAKQKSFEQMKESLLSARSEDGALLTHYNMRSCRTLFLLDTDSPRLEVSVECMSKEELHLLQRLAEHCLALFPDSYEANAAIAESCCVRLTPRESYSLLLCIGNQNCLARASQLTL